MVGHQLGGHSLVELRQQTKLYLGGNPSLSIILVISFSCFKCARFNFACFNFDAFVLQVSRFRGCHGEGDIA